jgi:hypothetical protein
MKLWRICEALERAWNFAKKPESTNVAMAIATIVIAVATWLTWQEVHNGSTQTDRIVAADERLAKANERFATAMENTVTQSQSALDKTLEKMQRQGKAMQDAARAANSQADTAKKSIATAIASDRAWVGVLFIAYPITGIRNPGQIQIRATNSGKAPLCSITSP